jgi:G3E family GTPase
MAKQRYVMIGGFLGAGKTTAMIQFAAYLSGRGLTSGLITNDQSVDLVDTARVRAVGLPVLEITGGCFCCKFPSLVEAARDLTTQAAPDVLVAEPVGSCTDLQATVSYPLRQLYGNDYRIAPLSVMVDPDRAAAALGLTAAESFSPKVLYVFDRQLEEAEFIVLNKVDRLDGATRQRLVAALGQRYPQARVLAVSCKTGEGLVPWFDAILAGELGRRDTMQVDYDLYAEGEALLGWLNGTADIHATEAFDGNELLLELTEQLHRDLASRSVQIAHLKLTLSGSAGELGAVSLTQTHAQPQTTHRLKTPLRQAVLTVNLRAEADPDLLRQQVTQVLKQGLTQSTTLQELSAFRPGRPTPTHRMATATA